MSGYNAPILWKSPWGQNPPWKWLRCKLSIGKRLQEENIQSFQHRCRFNVSLSVIRSRPLCQLFGEDSLAFLLLYPVLTDLQAIRERNIASSELRRSFDEQCVYLRGHTSREVADQGTCRKTSLTEVTRETVCSVRHVPFAPTTPSARRLFHVCIS